MGNVIELNDRRSGGGGPTEPTYPPRSYDVARVHLALLKVLPTAAYNLIGSEELTGIADLVVRTIDETREARLLIRRPTDARKLMNR